MKLVKFEDGCYGVRRMDCLGDYEFLEFFDKSRWWSMDFCVHVNCKATEAEARAAMIELSEISIKHKVVK